MWTLVLRRSQGNSNLSTCVDVAQIYTHKLDAMVTKTLSVLALVASLRKGKLSASLFPDYSIVQK